MVHDNNSWYRDAQCGGIGTEECFSEDTSNYDRGEKGRAAVRTLQKYHNLRKICATCPVRRECRLAGLGEATGMWGGLTPRERQDMRAHLVAGTPTGVDSFLDSIRKRINRLWDWRGVDGVIEAWPELDHPLLHEDRDPLDILDIDSMIIKEAATE